MKRRVQVTRWRRTGLAIGSVALLGATLAISPAAQAAIIYPVMNTSESPPDGVWFRYDALSNSDTARVTGLGVYAGEHMSVKCFWVGAPVGPYGNTIWYYGSDVERPTAPNGQANAGWMNTHYVDDGQTAGHAAPGVPQCAVGTGNGDGSAPPPPPPPPPPSYSWATSAKWKSGPLGMTLSITPSGLAQFDGVPAAPNVWSDAVSMAGLPPFNQAVINSLMEQLKCHLWWMFKTPYNLDTWRPYMPYTTQIRLRHPCNPT